MKKGTKSKSLTKESQSARTAALLSAAADLKQIASNFEEEAKRENDRFRRGVSLSKAEWWIENHLVDNHIAAIFDCPFPLHQSNGLPHNKKEFSLIIDTFRQYMPNIVTPLEQVYNNFYSKFTTYENLSRLDDRQIKFLTIRRRGKNIVSEVEALPKSNWKNIRVPAGDGKTRQLKVYDHTLFLRGYGKKIRQIAITGHGRIKPALIITNDFELAKEKIIRKYARRWLVEKSISEQTHFFHLNRVSSSMVIKVDFDLTMTILAYNLYRLLALNLSGYSHHTAEKIYEKFIQNGGKIQITKEEVIVFMKKKRHLPAILSAMRQLTPVHIPFIDKNLTFIAASYS